MTFDFRSSTSNVAAIVVTHQPDLHKLASLLTALSGQVCVTTIVDNGSSSSLVKEVENLSEKFYCRLFKNAGNLGVAAAQNIGIEIARKQGFEYVILFDQDSKPEGSMVRILLNALLTKRIEGIQVAAVGPSYCDHRQNNPPPFIRIKHCSVYRVACSSENDVVEVEYLISSGCLIPIAVLDMVGSMKDDLFIDYVDIEWGLRARAKGFISFGVCAAKMAHDLGDTPIKVFGKAFPVRSPLRHYYHFRNAISMYSRKDINLAWKIADGRRLAYRFLFYALFAKPRLTHLRMMCKGIKHGFFTKLGQHSETQ